MIWASAYPVAPWLLLHVEWFIARLVLGHTPVPNWDDPQGIPFAQWIDYLTMASFLALPAAACAWVVFTTLFLTSESSVTVGESVLVLGGLMLWIMFFVMMRFDPIGACAWWWD